MSAPTPGPWTLGEWDCNIFVYGGPNNDDIAEFNFADEHTVTITREEAIANARLFLAAPDLLAALIKLSNEVVGSLPLIELQARRDMGNTNYALLLQRADEARAAIAAATSP